MKMVRIHRLLLPSILLVHISIVCGQITESSMSALLDSNGVSGGPLRAPGHMKRRNLDLTRGKRSNKKSKSGKGDKMSTNTTEIYAGDSEEDSEEDSEDLSLIYDESDSLDSETADRKSHKAESNSRSKLSKSKDLESKESETKAKKAGSAKGSKKAKKSRSGSSRSKSTNKLSNTDAPSQPPVIVLQSMTNPPMPQEDSIDELPTNPSLEESIDEPGPVPSVSPTTASPTPVDTAPFIGKQVDIVTNYFFESGAQVTEPTPQEIFGLELATSLFYIGVFSEFYQNNTDTTFRRVVAKAEGINYNPNSEPPIQIEWDFEVSFSDDSVIPSREEILGVIYADEDILNQFVDIYLHSRNDLWSSVTTITYTTNESGESINRPVVESGLPKTAVEDISFLFQFDSNETVTVAPSQEEAQSLAIAISTFANALLRQEYLDSDETSLASVTASITEVLFEEGAVEPLQVHFDFRVFFSVDSEVIPTSVSIIEVLQRNQDGLSNFMEGFSWNEGEIWNAVSGVRIQSASTKQGKENKKKDP